jgi:hypothetical protein
VKHDAEHTQAEAAWKDYHARLCAFSSSSKHSCQGLVPQVPRVIGYGSTTWIRPGPPVAKWLGNHTLCTRDDPTTPG